MGDGFYAFWRRRAMFFPNIDLQLGVGGKVAGTNIQTGRNINTLEMDTVNS